jgi:hypothetical protein
MKQEIISERIFLLNHNSEFIIRKRSNVKYVSDSFLFGLHSTPMRISFQMEKGVDKEKKEEITRFTLKERCLLSNIYE